MRKLHLLSALLLAVATTAKAEETAGDWTDFKADSFSSINEGAQTITITSEAELALLTYHVYETGLYRDYTITLDEDLDMSGHYWIPIGMPSDGYEFTGTFNGQGHTISNLEVWVKQVKDNQQDPEESDATPNGNVAGLFGKIGAAGTVKNVRVSGPYVGVRNPTASGYIGGIAGINAGVIIGCGNAADVTGGYSADCVGGIAGENTGSVQNCYNIGPVSTSHTDNHIGGLVGDNKGTVSNCFIKCTVTEGSGSGSTTRPYPIIGNNGGTVTACFYAGGSIYDLPEPIAIADNADNTSTLSTCNGLTRHVLLDSRTLYADGDWNTLCLPFSIPAGASGYSPIAGATVMELNSSSFAGGTLTLNFKDATSIEAGKPYIVKWSNTAIGNLTNPVFQNMTVSSATNNVESTSVYFIGSFSPVAIAGEDNTILFLGTKNTLYYPNDAMTIGSCRAYFQLKDGLTAGDPGTGQSAIKAFALNFGDSDETGIQEMKNEELIINNEIGGVYDLSGRRVGNGKLKIENGKLPKGVYIIGGKKVLVK